MELAEAWAALGQSVANPHDESHARALVRGLQVIQKHDLSEHAVAWFLEQATEAAATDTVKRVWSCFDGFEKVESAKRRAVWANVRFLRALEIASSALDAQLEVAGGLESQLGPDHDVVSRCHANFTAVLFGSVSQASREAMYLFFENQFCEFEKSGWRPEGDVSMDDSVLSGLASDDEEDDDNEDMDLAEQDEWSIDSFKVMCSRIQHVGALPLAEEVFTEVLYSRIARVIQRVAEGTFDRALLSKIVTWAEHTVWPWLRLLLLVEDGEEDDDRVGLSEDCTESNEAPGLGAGSTFKQLRTRLQLFLYETLANLRISEMFDIIIDFPDSEPALDDLKAALSRTHQYPQLVTSLQQTFERRLLHPGANTSDIITQYISTIKALHRLDPSGTTLAAISRPVQAYLRGRPDTVRAIVTGLTDDSSSELFQELRKGGGEGRWRPRAQDWGEDVDDDGKGEGGADAAAAAAAWVPEPLQAGPNVDVYQKGSVDVIGMLVDVYGSTDLFLHEYRVLLSDKLLALTSYQIDREVHNVELLKVRFGEGSLHNCEVMLKDLSDSKRLDSYVHSESSKRALDGVAVDDWLNTKILSGAFWPQMPKEEVKMHSVIREQLESYGRYYSLLKKPRGLQWRPTLGVTKVTACFDDGRERQFTVSPVLANLLLHLQDKPTWRLADLAEATGMPIETVRKRMVFWTANAVCAETPAPPGKGIGETTYTAIETSSGAQRAQDAADYTMEEDERDAAADDGQEAVIVSYVVGMLTNFKTLPLDRIHNMLKMFVSDPPYTKSLPELRAILDRLVASDKLNSEGTDYTIKS